jgi:hypothetical protein
MRFRRLNSRPGPVGFSVLPMLVAVVVTLTAFEAAAHGHLPAVDGWHDTGVHGDTPADEGLKSCSICRLAHETSSTPVAPGTVSEPIRLDAPRPQDLSTLALAGPAREHSPRAPPCLASC